MMRFSDLNSDDWAKLVKYVTDRCERRLRNYYGVDPDDVASDVLASLLKRSFGESFDPTKGTFEQYLEGVIHHACTRALRTAVRHSMRRDDAGGPDASSDGNGGEDDPPGRDRRRRIDLKSIAGRERDPMAAAANREFVEAVKPAKALLSPAEREALPSVIERADGFRADCSPKNSTQHGRERRCRHRLRSLLSRFDPSPQRDGDDSNS